MSIRTFKSISSKALATLMLILLAVLAVPANQASAAVTAWYVNNLPSASCADNTTSNRGKSAASPFCTIGFASDQALAGDTINVLAGTYAERVAPTRSGTSTNPITYTAVAGVMVTGTRLASPTGTENGFRLSSKSYLVINGFAVSGTRDEGIYLDESDHITLTGNTVTNSGAPAAGTDRAGIYLVDSTNITISGNETALNSSHGIDIESSQAGTITTSNIMVNNNTSYGNASVYQRVSTGIIVQGKLTNNVTILHNKFYNNEDSGIALSGSSHNNFIVGNLSYGNGDHGIDVGGSSYAVVVGNTIQGNVSAGINLEANEDPLYNTNSSHGTVENNISVDNGTNPPDPSQPGNIRVDNSSTPNTVVDYNMVYQNGGATYVQYIWNTTYYYAIADFRTASSQEAHGMQANPVLLDPAPIAVRPAGGGHPTIETGNYHIASTSSAIDSANSGATTASLLTTDLDGKARVDVTSIANTGAGTYTYYDRGAYEYQLLPQTIDISTTPTDPSTVGVGSYTPQATATSGLPVVFTIDAVAQTICSINAGVVSFTNHGLCVVDANQGGNVVYAPAPQVQQSFHIKSSQTISFGTPLPTDAKVGQTYTPTATATSGLAVTITIDASATSVCSLSTGVVHYNAVGTCKVDANQTGDSNYNAAPQVQQSFSVGKGSQTVHFTSTAPTNPTIGGTYTPTATSTSGLPVTITVAGASAAVCSISSGLVHFDAIGSCEIDANQSGNANYDAADQVQQILTIKINQTISFGTPLPTDAKVGQTYTPAATATSGLPVTFTIDASASSVCSINTGVVQFNAAGTCKVDANQAGDDTYFAAPQVQQSFSVTKNSQTISFGTPLPTDAKVGQTYTPTATATSGLQVTITIDASSSSICSISSGVVHFNAVGTCNVDANQAGDGTYFAAPQVQQSISVTKNSQTINFTSTPPVFAQHGDSYTPTATATSGLPVTITIDASSSSVCSISSGVVHFNAVGTCKVDANQAGNGTYSAAPQVQQTITVGYLAYLPYICR